MTRYNCINGQNVQFTAEEEAVRDAEEAQTVIDQKIIDDAKANAIVKKESAVIKLKALGLNDEEIGALKI